MTVARIAISLDPKLARDIKRAARKQGTSAWLAEAARSQLRRESLSDVVADWELVHGKITWEEMEDLERKEKRRPKK